MRMLLVVVLCLSLAGCATSDTPGGKNWYKNRLSEIEQLKQDGKISDKEYIEMKNQADSIRSKRINTILGSD